MATIDVKDAAGATVAIEKPLATGSAAAASSRPVAFSTEDIARLGILTETAPVSDIASSGLNGRLQRIAQRLTSLIDSVVPLGQTTMSASQPVAIASNQTAIPITGSSSTTVSTDVTRMTGTTGYTANDAWADSDSAPTAGGFTFTGAARISGGSGIITDAVVTSSNDAATPLQGEVWIFDTAVTAVNDNVALVVSDAEIKTYVGKIPFALEDAGNNGASHVQGLNMGFTCVGSANLRFLVKVKNAYTPVSAEVLTLRLKITHTS